MYLLRRFHTTDAGAAYFYYNPHTEVPPADDGVVDPNPNPDDGDSV